MKTLSPEALLLVSLGIGLVPLMIAVGTCYLKFSIVLSLLRSGFGTQSAPSASLVMALSMVMSLVVMGPVMTKTREVCGDIRIAEVSKGTVDDVLRYALIVASPWRAFLLEHSGQHELQTIERLTSPRNGEGRTDSAAQEPTIIPALAAFVLSEIKKGFLIAFFLLIPFFVIDLIVANVLVALGLTMMSPSTVSLPLKLLLFVSSDGWLLLAKSLISAYR